MSIRENKKNRTFGKSIVENWIWVALGVYMSTTVIGWIGYIIGIIHLISIVLTTIGFPIFLFSIFYIRKLDRRTVGKYIWIVCGGLFLDGIMWFGIAYIFYSAPWAPLRNSDTIITGFFFILTTIISYGGAAYILDKLGKKRDFRPFI